MLSIGSSVVYRVYYGEIELAWGIADWAIIGTV